ncbi:hypothetical protein [Streptomyces uncialis]|uniref:hypothetical protein n=1 Tax=Streptomyces uncialis TaxID=1048205 RepID=UPI0037A85D14
MCALGNRLDLFQALAEWARRQGGTRIADRARRTVCTRLLCLSSAGHLTVDTAEGRERFVLLPEHAAVPAVEESPFSIAGAARLAPALSLLLDGVTEGFRPGGGGPASEQHAEALSRMTRQMSAGRLDSLLCRSGWPPSTAWRGSGGRYARRPRLQR